MSKLHSLSIWVFEMLCQAAGTAVWMTVLAFIYAQPGARNDLSFRVIFGVGAVVLIEFALTGYLLTTLISSLYLPRRQRLLYPLISGGLYVIHSEIFFVAAGNRILDKQNLSIQLGGACIAFALTLAGNNLRGIAQNARTQTSAFDTSI